MWCTRICGVFVVDKIHMTFVELTVYNYVYGKHEATNFKQNKIIK